ncbi:hypothetical protein [uncultured Stenotrophomonas sp.]|nr:hypothetical protein [uncultured Stenotrophomonas sp.]
MIAALRTSGKASIQKKFIGIPGMACRQRRLTVLFAPRFAGDHLERWQSG